MTIPINVWVVEMKRTLSDENKCNMCLSTVLGVNKDSSCNRYAVDIRGDKQTIFRKQNYERYKAVYIS